jgi:hypothetical protein
MFPKKYMPYNEQINKYKRAQKPPFKSPNLESQRAILHINSLKRTRFCGAPRRALFSKSSFGVESETSKALQEQASSSKDHNLQSAEPSIPL